ncbi:MAG: acyl-CoA dehydrogenase family protein, partial [Candidatus Aminicenantales bacterium]
MDAFLTPDEMALRQRIREYFRDGKASGGGAPPGPAGSHEAGALLKELGFPGPPGAGHEGKEAGLLDKALFVEEVSSASPRLGRELVPVLGGRARGEPGTDSEAAEIAWTIGAAAAVLEACLKAAREQGFFASTLMNHRKVQMALGDLLSGLESARLQSYRALRLIDGGDGARGREELRRAAGLARRARDIAM